MAKIPCLKPEYLQSADILKQAKAQIAPNGEWIPLPLETVTEEQFYALEEGRSVVLVVGGSKSVGQIRGVVSRDFDKTRVVFKNGTSVHISECVLVTKIVPEMGTITYIPSNVRHFSSNSGVVDGAAQPIFISDTVLADYYIPVGHWHYVIDEAWYLNEHKDAISNYASLGYVVK